jgi:hypothetical protein
VIRFEEQMALLFIANTAAFLALAFGFVIAHEKLTREHIQIEEPDLKIISDPNDIWRKSLDLLTKLLHERALDKYAYDVTTYMNKILYEEQVANLLEAGILFDRVFCFDEKSGRCSDLAIKYFCDKIIDGNELQREEIKDFESEFVRAFNGSTGKLSDEQLHRLNQIVEKQHKALIEGRLRIAQNPYPQHTDFIIIKYIPQGSQSEEHEVVANFKTHPSGLTYTIGIYGRRRIASEYRNMFEHVLWRPPYHGTS